MEGIGRVRRILSHIKDSYDAMTETGHSKDNNRDKTSTFMA